MATEIEPYKLSEIFSLIPEFDGDQIFLNTFLNACNHAYRMCIEDQRLLLTLHIKNKLRGRAAQLINSRDTQTWQDIRQLLTVHFGDSRDLTSLIQDLQRIHQLQNESPLTFVSRLQTHNAKMHACIQQQNLNPEQKEAQVQLIENMTLNTLLTGLEPKLGQIVRAGNPPDILTASMRIRRELQLSYFERQKFQKTNVVSQDKKPNNSFQKICSYCKKKGHIINECRQKQYFSNQNFQNQPMRNFNPQQTRNFNPQQTRNFNPQQTRNFNPQQSFQPRQNFPNNTQNQNFKSNNPNWNQNQFPRKPFTMPQNANQNIQQRNYHVNEFENFSENNYQNNSNFYDENNSQDYDFYQDNFSPEQQNPVQNFQTNQYLDDPPDLQDQIAKLETRVQTINLEQDFA